MQYAEPSQDDDSGEIVGAESEPEDNPAEPDAGEMTTRYPTRNRRPPDWYSTHITHLSCHQVVNMRRILSRRGTM